MLGVTLGSDLSWNDHISITAKAAACKLGPYLGLDDKTNKHVFVSNALKSIK